ncbi:MAG: pilus assembly protein TadG-related protein [Pseudomonadota bacterium]
MSNAHNTSHSFWKSKSGSTAMMASIFLPAMIGFGVLAVDVGHFYSMKTEMQQATDISGLAVLTEIRDAGDTDLLSVAQAAIDYGSNVQVFANRNMPKAAKNKAVQPQDVQFGQWDFTHKTFNAAANALPANAVRINAKLSEDRNNAAQTFFGKMFQDNVDIAVSSLAVLPLPASFHILSEDADGALVLRNGDIDVPRTMVNSRSEHAIDASVGSNVVGGFIRTTGQTPDLSHAAAIGQLATGVDPVADFLRHMPEPSPRTGCSSVIEFDELNPVIPAGRYCGGLFIRNFANATLEPGVFIIEDGPFVMENPVNSKGANNKPLIGTVQGDGVMLFISGRSASMQVLGGVLNLRAPTSGVHAGVAVFAARGSNAPPIMMIDDASAYFAGIFYAPDSRVDFFNSNVDGICTQVCLVAQTMRIAGAPTGSGASGGSNSAGRNGSTRVNYGSILQEQSSPFTPNGTEPLPPVPPALKRTFRPYIISE